MNREQWSRLRQLFGELESIPEAERSAFIDREVAGDEELRAELVRVLAASATGHEFFAAPSTARHGSIGPYRLLEILGEGGFGVVYLAEQTHPIRRRVALKLIKPGMDTKQVIARFEAERRALALMDHPCIAQVHEAGETESGHPYFVMEYVDGIPLTTYCDREKLRIPERLELFLQVCDAIQHAHQRGVIHRDIKPSNVLVAVRDGKPTPKLIDFGIVKATTESDTDTILGHTVMTREGMVVGTLGYMSPEQAGGAATVDTRSDIYSLGVLLYELLAGAPPFDAQRLRAAALSEAVRVIREEDPPTLTARLVQSGEREITQIAERRSVDPRRLVRELKGELQWVTLRAIEKDPERRYSSATELIADVRRHLANEPVLAGPPSATYRVRKFARRHRAVVAAAALVLLAIVAGGIASTIGFTRAVRAEHEARREAKAASQVSDYLVSVFKSSTPDRSRGETITARTLLEEGARRIRDTMKDDPQVRARLLTTLGSAHLNLALDDEGLALLREALAVSESAATPDPRQVTRQLYELANGLRSAGRRHDPEIGVLMDRALSILPESGDGSPELLASCLRVKGAWLNDRGERAAAEPLILRAIELHEAAATPDTLELISLYGTWGAIAGGEGRSQEEERRYLHALALTDSSGQSPSWAVDLHRRLAQCYTNLTDHEKAKSHAEEAVRLARKIYPPDHPGIAAALSAQVEALIGEGRYEDAIVVGEEHLRILRKSARRMELAHPLNTLGILYHTVGQADSAVARSEEAVAIRGETLGARSLRTAEMEINLARCLAQAGRTARAESSFRTVIAVFDSLDPKSIYNGHAYGSYATLCRDDGRFSMAETLYTHAEAIFDSTEVGTRRALGGYVVEHGYMRSLERRHPEAEAMIANGIRLVTIDAENADPELGPMYLGWAAARAAAGDPDGAIEKLSLASALGVDESDAASFPELAPLRTRPDYPLKKGSK